MKFLYKALTLITLLSLASCVSSKKVTYWQDALPSQSSKASDTKGNTNDSLSNANKEIDIRIQSFDVLDIRIKSSKQAFDNLLESNVPSIYSYGVVSSIAANANSSSQGATSQSGYYSGFLVNSNGEVNLPVIGLVSVKNLTIIEAKALLLEKAKDYLNNPFVDIKFLTFRVQVLGNVKLPGTYIIANEKANLLEVLSLAGDLSEFGNSKRIKILRGDLKTNYKVFLVDLTSLKDIRESEAYYLKPNDMIYVEPLPRKFFLANLTAVISVITIINSTLLVLSLATRGKY
jgi:polysaccharide export outer membrane protein